MDRWVLGVWTVAVCAVACGNATALPGRDARSVTPSPDAGAADGGPYKLGVEVGGACELDLPDVHVEINGERVNHASAMFPSFGAAADQQFVVETKYGDTVLDRVVVRPGFCEAESLCGEPPWELEFRGYIIAAGGRLTPIDAMCNSCTADWFCPGSDDCWPTRLNDCSTLGELRCGLLQVHSDPQFAYITCVPDGNVPVGGACTNGPPGIDTGYDDCARGALCVDGVCRAFCDADTPCATGTCMFALPVQPPIGTTQKYGYCSP